MAGGDFTFSSSDAGRDGADSTSPPPPPPPPRRPPPKAKTKGSGKPPKMGKAPKGKGSKGGKAMKGEKSGKVSKPAKSSKGARQRLVVHIPIKRGRGSAGPSSAASSSKSKRKGAGGGAKKKKGTKRGADEDDAAPSSGDEYTTNLLSTYIGQIGACAALGMGAGDVLNVGAWERLSEDERDSLRVHLPQGLSERGQDEAVRRVLSGDSMHFGAPRDDVWGDVVAGLTHPRVRRWRQRVTLAERRHHMMTLKDYQNRFARRVSAWKACKESSADALAGLAAVGGNLTKPGGPLLALPGLIHATAEAAASSGINEWGVQRWKRVLDFRNQETERYENPERAYTYRNPWGRSLVGPLKRGPALDGGRPREHGLLRNERPSHVTILCIVRDAASRLPNDRGTRADICDLLRDSQYLRDRATFAQLNTVVSGALDRLHYEENAPVRYDPETKEWCYLHNGMTEDDFETPLWALANSARAQNNGGYLGKSKKKRKVR